MKLQDSFERACAVIVSGSFAVAGGCYALNHLSAKPVEKPAAVSSLPNYDVTLQTRADRLCAFGKAGLYVAELNDKNRLSGVPLTWVKVAGDTVLSQRVFDADAQKFVQQSHLAPEKQPAPDVIARQNAMINDMIHNFSVACARTMPPKLERPPSGWPARPDHLTAVPGEAHVSL